MEIKTEEQLRKHIRLMLENLILEKRRKRRKVKKVSRETDHQEEIDPPITDLTKTWIEDQTRYKSMVRAALKRADGHLPIAADELGVSDRTLRRHINGNFAPGELDDLMASPGPDADWDVEAGKKRSRSDARKRKKRKRKIS